MSTSSQTVTSILPLLRDLSKLKRPGLSQAADAALELHTTVQSHSEDYQEVAADACRLVFVVADQLREKRQRNIDNTVKDNLESAASIQGNSESSPITPQNAFSSFWASDSNDLETLQEKVGQSLRTFNIPNFAELRNQADQRVKALNLSLPSVPSNGHTNGNYDRGQGPSNQSGNGVNQHDSGVVQQGNQIAQRDNGTVHSGNQYGTHMFNQASGFKIDGGEFNNVGGSLNKTTYHAKNVAANYGKLYGQNLGDGGHVNFNRFPE